MHADDETRRVYDQAADLYADSFPATGPELPIELAMIDYFVDLLPGSRRVLDAGCGAGRMLPYLARRDCVVEGVDVSPGMVRRAHADHPGFAVQVASLLQLPFSDDSFDGLFAWYSIIHSPDDDVVRMVGEMRRVLVPDGLALVAFQAGEGIRDVAQGYRARGVDVVLNRYHRTVGTVAAILGEGGFVPVATLERAAAGREADAQAVLIARVAKGR